MNQCLDLGILTSPPAVFLLHLSLTFLLSLFLQIVVRQEYPLANTQTMLEQAALSSCGLSPPSVNAPQGPQVILPLRSYTGDHPSDRKAQGRPPPTSDLEVS